jgi:hypothetical protein
MTVRQDGNNLIITVPLEKPHLSSTGKNYVVASSRGNYPTGVVIDGQPVILGLNAYIRKA